MAITIATGVVNVVPEMDAGRVVRTGNQAGERTGEAFVRGMDGRLRDARGRFATQARLTGDALVRGVDGRLRDARGRFANSAREAGETISDGIVDGLRAGESRIEAATDDIGEHITTGVDGRMRDARGRFVRSSNDMGDAMDGVRDSIGNATGAMGEMGKAASPLAGKLGAVGMAVGGIAAASALPAIGALGPMMLGQIGISQAAKLAFAGVGDALQHAGEDAEKFNEALKEMSPEQREFTLQLAKMKEGYKEFGKEIQKIVLPTFTEALKNAGPVVKIFKEGIRGSAEVFRDFGKEFGKMFAGDRFQAALKKNFELGNSFMRKFMLSLDDFTLSWLEFGAKSKPTVDAFSKGMSDLMAKGLPGFFDGLSKGIKGSGSMFDGLFDAINRIIPSFGSLSGSIGGTFGPVIGSLFRWLGDLVEMFTAIVTPAIDAMQPLFQSFAEAMNATSGAGQGLAGVIGRVLGAAVKVAIIPIKNLVDVVAIAAPFVKSLAQAVLSSLSPAFSSMNGKMGWTHTLQNFVKNNKLALQEVFARAADGVMGFVTTVVRYFPSVFSLFRNLSIVAIDAFDVMLKGAAEAFGWIPGVGPKLKNASKNFSGFKDNMIRDLNSAQGKIDRFSAAALPKLEKNRLLMNIRNWETQIATAKAELKRVPPEKQAALKAKITDLQNKVAQGKRSLASIPNKTATINGKNNTGGAVAGAKRGIGGVQGKTVNIGAKNQTGNAVAAAKRAIRSVVGRTVGILLKFNLGGAVGAARKFFGFANGGQVRVPGFANGGQVFNSLPFGGLLRGPGTGTSDSMLARVSNGEFIIRKRAVDFFGPQFFHGLNDMRLRPAAPSASVSAPAANPALTAGAAARANMPPVTNVYYQFQPGAIVLDASRIKDVQDLVNMMGSIRVTARKFGAKV